METHTREICEPEGRWVRGEWDRRSAKCVIKVEERTSGSGCCDVRSHATDSVSHELMRLRRNTHTEPYSRWLIRVDSNYRYDMCLLVLEIALNL